MAEVPNLGIHAHRFNADLQYAANLALSAKSVDYQQSRLILIEIGNICHNISRELEQVLR